VPASGRREDRAHALVVVVCRVAPFVRQDPGEVRAEVLVWGLRRIVDEVQATQLFYDKEGMPIKRRNPKKKLRALVF
jgi:hypothetical protein